MRHGKSTGTAYSGHAAGQTPEGHFTEA